MKQIRILSDCHGKSDQYLKILEGCEYSVQLGDMGFNYDHMNKIDTSKNIFLGGNHENYDLYYNAPGSLGDFGEFELNGIKFFFVRGSFSIDIKHRQKYERETGIKSWWEEEELSDQKLKEMVSLYKKVKPDLVLSHDCPTSISKIIGNPGVLRNFGFNPDTFKVRTQEALQECFEYHQVHSWFFAHYHQDFNIIKDNTRFICRKELGHIDLEENMNIL